MPAGNIYFWTIGHLYHDEEAGVVTLKYIHLDETIYVGPVPPGEGIELRTLTVPEEDYEESTGILKGTTFKVRRIESPV
jgi:hypothetical protein